jgi:hypothetical protein
MNIFQRWKQTALHNKALVLTGAIVALGTVLSTAAVISQVCLARQNNRNTSQQIEKLINAANIQGSAATSFADSATRINLGIGGAVDKLNLQVAAATRLARDLEIANNNILEADRPWMEAFISVANFEVGKKAIFSFTFTNSGKRPAKVDLTATRQNLYPGFPAEPDREYIFDTTPSTTIVVPGQSVSAPSTLPEPFAQPLMDLLNSGRFTYFAFGKVVYRDVRTDQPYWTHICLRYIPKFKSDTDNGFRNCAEYNDAK